MIQCKMFPTKWLGKFYSILNRALLLSQTDRLKTQWDASNEYPQHMFLSQNKKNFPKIINKYFPLTSPLNYDSNALLYVTRRLIG